MEQSQALELLIKSQAEQIRQLTEANAKQAEQMTDLQQKIDKLLSQIAWFTRQFYGRKSEKLSRLDPNQLNLFETLEDEKKHLEEIEAERIEAENQIEENISSRKKTRSNRKLLEGLPGASLLSEIMLGKYEYHLPFYRQIKQFHHLGVKKPSNTLSQKPHG